MELDETDDEGSLASRSTSPRTNERESRPGATSDNSTSRSTSDRSPNDSVGIHSPGSPFTLAGPRLQNSISVASLLRQPIPDGVQPYSQDAISLTHVEARLVHYYSENLGSWLDCTDATRQFTLGVPEKVRHSPVLCHAVVSFAARHLKEDAVAEAAYQRCIALLIERLGQPNASHDETLLCTIVVLRFYEQLNGTVCRSTRRASAYVYCSFYNRFRCWAALSRLFCHPTCFSGQSLRRPFRAYTSRSCILGLCSPVSLHRDYQPAAS